ncbi:MAG: CdaR family protein, partial [Bacteroidales bacterium]
QNIRKKPEIRRKAFIFLLCLVFSFISWLFIKLSRESAAIVPVKIEVINTPPDVIITGKSDSIFVVNVKSTGVKLLSSGLMRRVETFETDFSALQQLRRNNGNIVYFFTAPQAQTRFSVISDIPRSALSVHPDTIFFYTIDTFSKKVPIKLERDLQLRKGFRIYDIPTLSPDSVTVFGPITLSDSIDYITTEKLTATSVDENINKTVRLENPWKTHQISLSEIDTDVFIPVEEFTETTVSLPVAVDCTWNSRVNPDDLLLFPDQVDVHYLVALKDDSAITPDMFSAFVNCPDTLNVDRYRLTVEIREKPALVDILRIRPAEVEYIWIKRQ